MNILPNNTIVLKRYKSLRYFLHHKSYAVALLFLITTNSTIAQDYFPLELGYKWEYDNFTSNLFTHEVIDVDTTETLPKIIIFTVNQDFGASSFPTYYYKLLSNPNNIFQIVSKELAQELKCNFSFKHDYEEGDVLPCQNRFINNAVFYGTYTTKRDLIFDNCWSVQISEIDSSTNDMIIQQSFVIAPDIGIVAVLNRILNPIYELASHNFFLSHAEKLEEPEIIIYPNPSDHFINIDAPEHQLPDHLYILDPTGKIIKQVKSKFIETMNISDLDSGLYYLVGQKTNNTIWIKSFVKS